MSRSFAGTLAFLWALCGCSATPGSNAYNNPEGLGGATSAAGAAGKATAGAGGTLGALAGGAAVSGAPGGGSSPGGAANGGSGGAGSAGASNPPVPKPASPTASWVYLSGYQLMVGKRASDGTLATPAPFKVKGVGWSPTGIGESNSQGYVKLYTSHGGTDIPLIAGLHANVVKTYDPFERTAQGTALLDQLYASGVMVIMNVMASHNTSQSDCLTTVSYFKNHPAILGWMVGNEFNYNNLYGAANLDAAISIVKAAISAIHVADPDHPVLLSHGEVPTADTYSRIPEADIWALNLYPSLDLDSRFVAWAALSKKPMMVGEYGADAFNNNTNAEDQASQATATSTLTAQIIQHYSASAVDSAHLVLGGTIYSLSDEWWKEGNNSAHDNGGIANAIYPDNFANEEWWGLTTV
ncbi:MAG TPA: glycoside hydrolase family 2 TIM barrel-domain containing protein, partial [Polyangiaceae bacterium]